DSQGYVAEIENTVISKYEQQAKCILGLPPGSLVPLIWDTNLIETNPGTHATNEPTLLRHGYHYVIDPPGNHAKVPTVQGNVDFANHPKKPIETPIKHSLEWSLLALASDRVDYVIPLLNLLVENH